MGELLDDVRARREAREKASDERASRADRRRQAKGAKARDREHQRAYEAGKSGSHPREAFDGDDELQSSYDAGAQEHKENDRAHRLNSAPGLVTGAPKLDWVSNGAGVLVGLVAYALVLQFLRGGPAAVRGWLAAKFINRPYTGSYSAPGSFSGATFGSGYAAGPNGAGNFAPPPIITPPASSGGGAPPPRPL